MLYYINFDTIYFRKESFGGLLFDIPSYTYCYLNKLSTHIMYSFSTGASISSVLESTCQEFPNVSPPSIRVFIEDLINKNYISKNPCLNNLDLSLPRLPSNNLSAPIELTINPDYVCNQRCKFCYLQSSVKPTPLVRPIDIDNLLKQYGWSSIFSVNILGGEPLINTDKTFAFMDVINSNNKRISVTTNGSTCEGKEEYVSQKLASYRHLEIAVSLVSSIASVHDTITNGVGNFDKTIKFLKHLVDYVKNISVNTVIADYNIDHLFSMATLLKDIGVKVFSITPPIPCTNSKCNKYDFDALNIDLIAQQANKLQELESKDFHILLKTGSGNHTPQSNSYLQLPGLSYTIGCAAGNRSLELDCNGDVYPCSTFLGNKDYLLGNIFTNSFNDIWENQTLNLFRHNVMLCHAELQS